MDNEQNSKEITTFFANLSSKDLKNLSQFVKTVKPEDLKITTRASPILVGDVEEIGIAKLDPRDIEKYLWMHPVVPRGIEIKANSMIKRGFTISPPIHPINPTKAKQASQAMNDLIENSGGAVSIKRWIEDAYGFGTGFRTLVTNKAGNRVLKVNAEHPIYFRIRRYPDNFKIEEKKNKMIIDPRTKEPPFYNQVKWDKIMNKWVQLKPIPYERVASLVFDTWGDELVGIPIVQYVHLTLKYLMNIEEAAAETLYRNGFVQKKVTTDINNEKDLKKLAKSLALINRKDAIILPRGTNVENLNPGDSDFPEFHAIFIKLLATRLGVPLPFLTQDGTSTNKATIQEMSKLMYQDFSADELIVKQAIENRIFKPACKLQFGRTFEDIPIFEFNEVPEDTEVRADRLVKESMAIQNLVTSAQQLENMGRSDESNLIIEYLKSQLHLESRVSDKASLEKPKAKLNHPKKKKPQVEPKSNQNEQLAFLERMKKSKDEDS